MKTFKYLLLNAAFVGAMLAQSLHTGTGAELRNSGKTSVGYASYYSNYYNGKKTASGERFSNSAYTAASNQLPLGSRVRVTNLKTKRSVIVRVTDRGPYVKGRAIDLSRRAARDLGMLRQGVARVQITRIS